MRGFPRLLRTATGAGGLVFAGPAAAGPLSGVRGGPTHSDDGTLTCPAATHAPERKPSPATCARPGQCSPRSRAISMAALPGFLPSSRPCAGFPCRPPARPVRPRGRLAPTPAGARVR